MYEMLQRSITPEIEVKLILDSGNRTAFLDAGDFEDTLINLAVNARDAIGGSGELIIETRHKVLTEQDPLLGTNMKPGDYIQISVSDNGAGMSKETIDHLFEPFFTTKDETHGTGLGLSQVYGFVERARGNIRVYSEIGIGSSFHIYLPQAANVSDDLDAEQEQQKIPHGDETILLVDDEKELLSIGREMLEKMGYSVLVANNAESALAVFDKHGAVIDLLLSDVIMPGGLNGYELAKKLRTVKPDLKILLASGYTRNAISADDIESRTNNLLSKPFSMLELGLAIRDTLDG